jgi:NAD(P)-dependent dehydrogenase (short-subunit alcohol dehydrogenase family)
VCDRLGRCEAVIISPGPTPFVDFDELSRDEWEPMVSGGLTAPLVTAQAFGRVLERAGGGTVIVVDDGASHENVPGAILSESLRSLGAHLSVVWRDRTLRCLVVSREGAPDRIVAALS